MASGRALAHLSPKQKKAKQQARDDAARTQLGNTLPADYLQNVKHPARFLKNLQSGKGPALGRMAMLQAGARELGAYKVQDPLQQHTLNELAAGAPVDYKKGEVPTEDEYSKYVRQHLGQSLSPEETAAIRTPERQAVESGAREASRGEMSRLSAAGIDPRSGVAADRAMQIERARQSGLGDVERDVVQARLQRQREFEGEAAGQSGREEQARQYDVGAGLRRLSDVEQNASNLAGLDERQREYDSSFAEGQRQSDRQLALSRRAASVLKPTGVQQVSGVIGGVVGGIAGH